MLSSGLTPNLISASVTFRSCSPHFTVKLCWKLWFPQTLPNFGYGRQIMHTDVKKQGLPQMSGNRPSIWFTGIGNRQLAPSNTQHKTTFDRLWNTLACHRHACHVKRRYTTIKTSKWPFCCTRYEHCYTSLARTVYEPLRTAAEVLRRLHKKT